MEKALLLALTLILALLYLLLTFSSAANRTSRGKRRISLGLTGAAAASWGTWYTVFFGPCSRNWGLGGSYLWILGGALIYLLLGVIITACNNRNTKHRKVGSS
ncbi:MAG: hypothetical protein IKD37_07995 [Clostridia bacterium]|nr:hypothetical protein [Clostridia bacterium]